jgi:cytochrome c oxidase cbb3-type subunit III
MKILGLAILLVANLLAAKLAAAQEQVSENSVAERTHAFLGLAPAPDSAAAERGAKTYAANCTFCHGVKATGGDTGPDLIRSTAVLHDQKGEIIAPVIRGGRPALGMPAFPTFSDAQLYDLAEFLHMRVELTANRGEYRFLSAIRGDAKAGETYFRGAGQCIRCHSVSGDLAHVASKYSGVDLQQRFLYPEPRQEAKQPSNATIRLSSTETISGKLCYLDDFVAVIAEDDGSIRSVERNANVQIVVDDPLAAHRELLDRYQDSDIHNLTAYLATLK